jgi:hypothetical protein
MPRHSPILLSDLEDRMRLLVRRRIVAGEISGAELARCAGLRQTQIARLLGRCSLTVEAVDRVLQAMQWDVHDLMPDSALPEAANAGGEVAFEAVPLVKPAALLHRQVEPCNIVECLRFKKSFLRLLRVEMASARSSWRRFVLVRAGKDLGSAMFPRVVPGVLVLVDRHYNSLRSYRRKVPNLYVVSGGGGWHICYAEVHGGKLALRPENHRYPLRMIEPVQGKTYADYLAGRIAHISMEL